MQDKVTELANVLVELGRSQEWERIAPSLEKILVWMDSETPPTDLLRWIKAEILSLRIDKDIPSIMIQRDPSTGENQIIDCHGRDLRWRCMGL